MFNFLPRTKHDIPRSVLRPWLLASTTMPFIIPAILLSLIAGAAAATGNSFAGTLGHLVVEISGDWLRLFVMLWLTAYFMAAIFFGVGRQLIGLTVRRMLSTPLATMVARLRKLPRFLRGNCRLRWSGTLIPILFLDSSWFLIRLHRVKTTAGSADRRHTPTGIAPKFSLFDDPLPGVLDARVVAAFAMPDAIICHLWRTSF